MTFAIIIIPFDPVTKGFHPDELNRFCLNKKIVAKKIEFFKDGEAVYWSIFIEYETVLENAGRENVGLTQAGKLCYEKLRVWRKETAERSRIPPFVIAKNSQFVKIINIYKVTFDWPLYFETQINMTAGERGKYIYPSYCYKLSFSRLYIGNSTPFVPLLFRKRKRRGKGCVEEKLTAKHPVYLLLWAREGIEDAFRLW